VVQNELGKGAFQELDQVKAVQQFCKYAGQAASAQDIVPTVTAAVKVCQATCCACLPACLPD
jgi:thiamine pyrophosphate-dependent acetolactate synthase large subunit-like protein